MRHTVNNQLKKNQPLMKSPTGMNGIDEITVGGLPLGRNTLVCGGPGCGKTIFGMEFLIRGASKYNEPGLFISFEESEEELTQNFISFGYNLDDLIRENKIVLDFVEVNRSDLGETGSYNLDGLFIRISDVITRFGIKRIVLDTIEVLFSNFRNEKFLRAELQRLFRWFKDKGVTVIITAEKGESKYSRYGLEEYIADCVFVLDHRIENQISTRRLRIAKYRGSPHGSNEYPFLIGENGISVLAITSDMLDYKVSNKFVSSGIKSLDYMLEGKGFYEGSSVLITGPSGGGKSSFAAAFANSVCESGKRCLYFSFEESTQQIIRNMKSIGFGLEKWLKQDLLRFSTVNTSSVGLEAHLVIIKNLIDEFKPSAVVIDPITNFKQIGTLSTVKNMLSRIISMLKENLITVVCTSLQADGNIFSKTDEEVSSLMDVWLQLGYVEGEGERNRTFIVNKARGLAHSNQIREVKLSKKGFIFKDVSLEGGRILAGASRLEQDLERELENLHLHHEIISKENEIAKRRKKLQEEKIAIEESLEEENKKLLNLAKERKQVGKIVSKYRSKISDIRMAEKNK